MFLFFVISLWNVSHCAHRVVHAGNDEATAAAVEQMGGKHVTCAPQDTCVDSENRVVTTPAYMYGEARPHEVFDGIGNMIRDLLAMLRAPQ